MHANNYIEKRRQVYTQKERKQKEIKIWFLILDTSTATNKYMLVTVYS